MTASSGFHSGTECFVNSPNNVSVGGGVLSLTVRKEAAPFTCASPVGSYATQYTSGSVLTYGLFSQAYGRFEVRAKLPSAAVKGLQESFWLWPDNSNKYGYYWPQSGEIDIAEMYSQYADRAIPYIHYVPAVTDPNVTNTNCLISDISAFHTYVAEWTPTTITIKYDGQTCVIDTPQRRRPAARAAVRPALHGVAHAGPRDRHEHPRRQHAAAGDHPGRLRAGLEVAPHLAQGHICAIRRHEGAGGWRRCASRQGSRPSCRIGRHPLRRPGGSRYRAGSGPRRNPDDAVHALRAQRRR